MSQSAAKTLEEKYGIIYMATSPSGKKYIGQHNTDDLATRIRTHNYNFIEFIKQKCILELNKKFYPDEKFPDNPKGYCTAFYNAMCKYPFRDFKWEVIEENIPLDELNDIEDRLIIEHNSLVPNGYNLKMNHRHGQHSAYSDETRKKMSASSVIKVRDNLHNYRKKHEELKDVPQFVTYFESGGIRGYRIVRHPKCKSKQFADADTPVVELKRQLLEFLKACEDEPFQTTQQKKATKGIPKGISEQKPGRFLVQFSLRGTRYTKFFSQEPRESALQLATEWMQNKKEELNNLLQE